MFMFYAPSQLIFHAFIYQRLVSAQVPLLFKFIRTMYYAEQLERTVTKGRMDFLRNYVEAQMVNLEEGQFVGWFYWNFKMEGGMFLEWDL